MAATVQVVRDEPDFIHRLAVQRTQEVRAGIGNTHRAGQLGLKKRFTDVNSEEALKLGWVTPLRSQTET